MNELDKMKEKEDFEPISLYLNQLIINVYSHALVAERKVLYSVACYDIMATIKIRAHRTRLWVPPGRGYALRSRKASGVRSQSSGARMDLMSLHWVQTQIGANSIVD
jgi:hypothetical protein